MMAEKKTPCETGVTATKDIPELHPKLDLGGRGPQHWYQRGPGFSAISLLLPIAVQPSKRHSISPPDWRVCLRQRRRYNLRPTLLQCTSLRVQTTQLGLRRHRSPLTMRETLKPVQLVEARVRLLQLSSGPRSTWAIRLQGD